MQDSAASSSSATVLEPDLPIIDPHHHLWMKPHGGGRYFVEEFAADLATGHNILSTVYIECSAYYRASGPEHLRPVGEAEFVAGMAAMSASGEFGPARIAEGFVGAVDFTLGNKVDEALDALAVASGGRLRGIRGTMTWDADPSVNTGSRPFAPEGLMLDNQFRKGFAQLVERNLVYDAFQYHPQLSDVCSLADAFPRATIIVNHCGGLLRIGPYSGDETFGRWKALIQETARRPNTYMKLGGLAGRRCGFNYDKRPPRTADDLVKDWKPYFETCIEAFGPERCMFESNFSPDAAAADYRTIWNSFKLIAAKCSAQEKTALFSGTARKVYRLS